MAPLAPQRIEVVWLEHGNATQERLHSAIEAALHAEGDLEDDQLLTGWVVIFEATSLGGSSSAAGQMHGPGGMTVWKSLGLIEWARRFLLEPADEDGDG